MNYSDRSRKSRRPSSVREPVQVYLDREDQDRLSRLTERLGTSKSDALRRGLSALERQLFDPSDHPALRIVGIAREGSSDDSDADRDAALDHDVILADAEVASWAHSDDA